MKGQATIELLFLFLVMLGMVAMITGPILDSYSLISGKSEGAMKRAAVENEILAGEIWCNSGTSSTAPRQLLESGIGQNPMQVEKWYVNVVGGKYTGSRFTGIFKGCTDETHKRKKYA